MGKQWKQCQTLFFWAPKSLQTVTAAMKLKDAYSLEGKLCRGGEDGKRRGQQEQKSSILGSLAQVVYWDGPCLATWSSLEFKPSAHSANTVGLWS